MNKPRFVAKAVIKKEDNELPLVQSDHFVARTTPQQQPAIPTYDLEQNLNLSQLAENLKININSYKPSSCVFLWSGKRSNEKLRLDVEHQRLIIDQINNLALAADEMANTQAKLFLIPEVVNDIINEHRDRVALAREKVVTEYRQTLAERLRADLEVERLRLENDDKKAESRLKVLRGDLIEKITKDEDLDFNKISPQFAFVLIKALNQDSTESDIFMAQEQLDRMRAEADIKAAEAKKAESEAKYEEFKVKESMKPPKE